METRTLGKTKFELSGIGLGTVQFGLDYGLTKKKTQDEVDEILFYANQKGINFLDTASGYGDSEEKIGNFISQNKNNFIVATKLDKLSKEQAEKDEALRSFVLKSVETSLEKLKQPRINILQLHQTDEYLIENENFWSVLEELKEEKIIESLGVSLYEEEEALLLLEKYSDIIDLIQVPYSVFDRRFEHLESYFLQTNTGVIARSVFLKGMIVCSDEKLPKELHGLRPYKKKLATIGLEKGLKENDIALLFAYNQKFIGSIILGVDSIQELEQNIDTISKKNILTELSEFDEIRIDDRRLVDPRKWTSI